MRVVVATAASVTDATRVGRKLTKIIGGLKTLVVYCRKREQAVHDWCHRRVPGVMYCVFHANEPDVEMLREADALVAFRGPRADPDLDRLVKAAEKKGIKARIIEHRRRTT